jgi:hypothetical protein
MPLGIAPARPTRFNNSLKKRKRKKGKEKNEKGGEES